MQTVKSCRKEGTIGREVWRLTLACGCQKRVDAKHERPAPLRAKCVIHDRTPLTFAAKEE